MRSRRNLLLILLIVILIFAVIYFVRQRQDAQVATNETPTAELSETGDETPTDSEEPLETTDETTPDPDTVTADTSPDTGDTSSAESPAESEESPDPAETSEEEAAETDQTSEEAEPAEAEEASSTEDTPADAETTETETPDTTTETPETTVEETAETTMPATGPTITYIVKPGDNLFLIGLPYGLQWTEIAAVNDLDDPNDLEVGQEILIPTRAGVPQPPPVVPTTPTTHRVQPGENLFRIALRYNMDYITLARANNIGQPYTIYVGQTLTIPGR